MTPLEVRRLGVMPYADALAILGRYAIEVPASVRAILADGRGESLKPGVQRLEFGCNRRRVEATDPEKR